MFDSNFITQLPIIVVFVFALVLFVLANRSAHGTVLKKKEGRLEANSVTQLASLTFLTCTLQKTEGQNHHHPWRTGGLIITNQNNPHSPLIKSSTSHSVSNQSVRDCNIAQCPTPCSVVFSSSHIMVTGQRDRCWLHWPCPVQPPNRHRSVSNQPVKDCTRTHSKAEISQLLSTDCQRSSSQHPRTTKITTTIQITAISHSFILV